MGSDSAEPRNERGAEGPFEELSLRRIEVLNLCLVAAAGLAALGVSRPFFWGVLAGGALGAANFRIIVAVVRSMFSASSRGAGLKAGAYWFKFSALLGLVGVLILWVKVDGVGFVVGMSTLLVAVAAEGALRLVRK